MDATHGTVALSRSLENYEIDSGDSTAIASTLHASSCENSIVRTISEHMRDGVNWLEG